MTCKVYAIDIIISQARSGFIPRARRVRVQSLLIIITTVLYIIIIVPVGFEKVRKHSCARKAQSLALEIQKYILKSIKSQHLPSYTCTYV